MRNIHDFSETDREEIRQQFIREFRLMPAMSRDQMRAALNVRKIFTRDEIEQTIQEVREHA